MIRPMILSIALLLVPSLAGVSASEIPTTTYEGTVLVRTDAHGRVAVVLDADGDGYADRLFVFDPYEVLPQGLPEREARATVFTCARELRVLSADAGVALQLYPSSPTEGAASTIQIGHHVVAHGKALVEIPSTRGGGTPAPRALCRSAPCRTRASSTTRVDRRA